MSPHQPSSSRHHDSVEPRRRTVRSSGASGHRIRTVAGIPTVTGGPLSRLPQGESKSKHSAADPQESTELAGVSLAAGPGEGLAAESEPATRSSASAPRVQPAGRRVGDDQQQYSKGTYVVAGIVVALLCFVATRPLWQSNGAPAPAIIQESTLAASSAPAAAADEAPQREYVALPASQTPTQLGTYESPQPMPELDHPSLPASGSVTTELARRDTVADAEPSDGNPAWDQEQVPHLAIRPEPPTQSAFANGPAATSAPAAQPNQDGAYPSTNYPVIAPPSGARTDAPADAPSRRSEASNARLDGNILPLQSDES